MGTLPIVTTFPQFEPISSLPPLQGFDRNVFPRWQMIPNGSFKHVFLDHAGLPGPNLTVAIVHPNKAELREITSVPPVPRREFKITGKVAGHSSVQVFAPNGTTVIGQLQIVVKDEALYKIAFHRVTDGLIETTARPQAIGNNLLQELNSIFGGQANVRFDSPYLGVSPLSLKTTLHELAMEQREPRRPQRGWDELDAQGDSNSHINVYFMKWHLASSRLPSQVLEKNSNFVFHDDMPESAVLTALAHRIGLFLGCSVSSSDRDANNIMHSARADGINRGTAGVHFISRDCSNTMNP